MDLKQEVAKDEELDAHFEYTVAQLLKREGSISLGSRMTIVDITDLSFTPLFRKGLAKVIKAYCGKISVDLEAFAKHAKRSTINTDDVKLVLRQNAQLTATLAEKVSEIQEKAKVEREQKKKAKSK